MDINRDGVITFDEFMETCRRVSMEGLYFKVNKQARRHPAETWRNRWQFLYKNVKTGQQSVTNSLTYLDFFCLRAHVQYHTLLKSVSYDKNRKSNRNPLDIFWISWSRAWYTSRTIRRGNYRLFYWIQSWVNGKDAQRDLVMARLILT